MTDRQKILPVRSTQPTTRPLLARPGAAFRCFGDGLCCTDIHALGVLTRSEVRELRKRDKLSVIYSEAVDGFCLKPIDGRCLFLDGADRCQLHAKYGAEAKPVGCRRFPYGLVSTPYGGRVTTEHRCPCRTLGARPEVSLEDAEMSLRDRSGRLESDKEVPARIAMRQGQRVSFANYVAIESELIERLNAGERAEDVLAAKALPELADGSWATVAMEHLEMRDATQGGEMFAWFADALLELSAGYAPPQRQRPWAWAYARASARVGSAGQTAEEVYNDWIADEIWMFRWLDWGPFDVARAELATRLKIARQMQSRIELEGVSAQQAAAEAVMICELICEAEEWPKVVGQILTVPSPADLLSVPAQTAAS